MKDERCSSDSSVPPPFSRSVPRPGTVWIEVSAGELLDKISILRIKSQRLSDPAKLAHVRTKLAELEAVPSQPLETPAAGTEPKGRRQEGNERRERIEDGRRLCERAHDFGPRLRAVARWVYRENGAQSGLKRAVNELIGSRLIEEESYP